MRDGYRSKATAAVVRRVAHDKGLVEAVLEAVATVRRSAETISLISELPLPLVRSILGSMTHHGLITKVSGKFKRCYPAAARNSSLPTISP